MSKLFSYQATALLVFFTALFLASFNDPKDLFMIQVGGVYIALLLIGAALNDDVRAVYYKYSYSLIAYKRV